MNLMTFIIYIKPIFTKSYTVKISFYSLSHYLNLDKPFLGNVLIIYINALIYNKKIGSKGRVTVHPKAR